MEMDTWSHLLRQLSADKAIYLWALVLAVREIRRLYTTQRDETVRICKQVEARNVLLQRELDRCQRTLSDLFHKRSRP